MRRRTGRFIYAWQHNRTEEHDTPIIIEFEAERDVVAVDGKDFLYTVFQLGDPGRARDVLKRSFGRRMLHYADRAWASNDGDLRIALCDLAIHDPEIVEAHYKSQVIIGGRHGTRFRNAFTVRLPVDCTAVIRAWSPTAQPSFLPTDIMLADVLQHQRW